MEGHRLRYINWWFVGSFQKVYATSDAADEIIEAPDRHLMNADDLYAAEGGATTLGFQMALTAGAVAGACMMNPRLATYFKNGQLRWNEWGMLLGSGAAAYMAGQTIGTRVFGNHQAVKNHWLAYNFVKAQNRGQQDLLANKP